MKLMKRISFLFAMVLQGCCSDLSEYDYDEYNEYNVETSEEESENAVTSIPQFLSQPTNLAVDSGETFSLPCYITKTDDYALMWIKDGEIISLGNKIIKSEEDRYSLEVNDQGNKLVIQHAVPQDRGNYRCQVSSYNLAYIDHTVTVRVEPVIETYPKGQVFLREGESVQLLCYLYAGEPQPEVYWMIRNTENDTEHLEQQLDLTNVSRHHSGQYICIADNGYGLKPVSKEVAVSVQYAPEMSIEQVYLSSDKGSYIIISCSVESSPRARVIWSKDGQRILPEWPDQDQYALIIDRNKHNLLLKTVTAESFGVYSCSAENSLGAAQVSTDVSGHGCWATHKYEQLSADDINIFADNEHIDKGNIQYGVACKQPFTDFIVEAASTTGKDVIAIQTASSNKQIDHFSEKKQVTYPTQMSTEQTERRISGNKEQIANTNSVYLHKGIDDNDEVKLQTYTEAVNAASEYPEYIQDVKNRKNDSEILSVESRTETVDIFLPYNKIDDHTKVNKDSENKIPLIEKKDEILTLKEERPPSETEHKVHNTNKSINSGTNYESLKEENKTKVDDIRREDRIGNQTKVIIERKSNLMNSSNAHGKDEKGEIDNMLLKNEKVIEPSRELVNPITNKSVMATNETEANTLTTGMNKEKPANRAIQARESKKTAGVPIQEEGLDAVGQLVYRKENKTNEKYEPKHSNFIRMDNGDKDNVKHTKESDIDIRSKPNITFTVKSGKEEPLRNIRKLVSKYKSIKFEECNISENSVVENTNTIKMTSQRTALDCHIDCQVTEGCLGWFLGNVGGVKSCVLYGCGEFRKIDQQGSVSCRIGDCIDGWLEELYSCKYKDYYRYVGEERWERIVQAEGRASQFSSNTLCFLILWIPVFVLRL